MLSSVGHVTDRDGDRVDVEVDGADVFIAVNSSTHCVVLDEQQQEEFAQLYVAACHQAKAWAASAGSAQRKPRRDA